MIESLKEIALVSKEICEKSDNKRVRYDCHLYIAFIAHPMVSHWMKSLTLAFKDSYTIRTTDPLWFAHKPHLRHDCLGIK